MAQPLAQLIFAGGLVGLAAAGVAVSAIGTPFHGLDTHYILDNTALRTWDHVVDAHRYPGTGPLGLALQYLGIRAVPDGAAGLRLFGILLHACASVAVYLLARLIVRTPGREVLPMSAGLLFAVHPVAVSVALTPTFLAVQALTVLALCAAVSFVASVRDGMRLRFGWYLAALVCAGLAFAAHSGAWMVAILVIGTDITARAGGLYWHRVRLYLPFVFVALAGWVYGATEGQGANDFGAAAGLGRRALGHLVWPWNGLLHYADGTSPAGWLLCVPVVLVVFVLLWRRSALGVALFLLLGGLWAAYLPGTGLGFSDGPAYLGLAGLVLLAPLCIRVLPAVPGIPQFAGALLALLIVLSLWVSFQNVLLRQAPEILWRAVQARYPEDGYAAYQIGRLRLARGEAMLQDASTLAGAKRMTDAQAMLDDSAEVFASALETLQQAVAVAPTNRAYQFALGNGLFYMGRDEDAAQAFTAALAADPDDQASAIRIAMLAQAHFDGTKARTSLLRAIDHYRVAQRNEPLPADVVQRAVAAYVESGLFEEAQDVVTATIDQPGGGGEQLAQIASELAERIARADSLEGQALELAAADADSVEALLAAGRVHAFRNRPLHAIYAFEAAYRAAPDDSRAWIQLGLSYGAMHRPGAFLVHFGTAPGEPGDREPWDSLARAAIATGAYESAATYLGSDGARAAGIERPSVLVADLAWDTAPVDTLKGLLEDATETAPRDPLPWLRLADLVISRGGAGSEAVAYLEAAEERGASETELQQRRLQLESALVPSQGPLPADAAAVD